MDAIIFERPEWVLPCFGVWFFLMAVTWWSYHRNAWKIRGQIVGLLLKGTGLACILLSLLGPTAVLSRPKPQANVFGIVVDNSQSMLVGNRNPTPQSPSPLTEPLRDDANWQLQLAEDFRVRRYVFDKSLQPVDSFQGLKWDGPLSTFNETLTTLQQRYAGRPLAGLLLFSDGQATDQDSQENEAMWRSFGCPIYPVKLSGSENIRDLRIANLTLRQSDFEAAPVSIAATIASQGLSGRDAVIELLDDAGKQVQSRQVTLNDQAIGQTSEFRFRPERSGVQGYRVHCRLVEDMPASSPSPQTEAASSSVERTLGNNRRHQVIDRGRGPYRILYVSGRPNWEHKFLKRALEEDGELRLASLLRIAKKEPKFSFRDNRVDSSNPLFSGFEGISEEEKEQYNQPVFVRLGDLKPDQLQGGFPKSAEELFDYHAILIDDLEHDFFEQSQQLLLRRFVTERGGALLMLGGQESMRGNGFSDSILSQLLPVYGENPAEGEGSILPYRLELTREGWQQPFLRTAQTEAEERIQREKLPPFEVLNRSGDLKPGASTLLTGVTPGGEQNPALVWQRFGKGKTVAFMVGDFWRWGMHADESQSAQLPQAWRQMIRWLIADVPKRYTLQATTSSAGGRARKLIVEAKQVDFEPLDNAKVELTLKKPNGDSFPIVAEASSDRRGQYEATVVHDEEGVYTAEARITSPNGQEVGLAETGWIYEPSTLEFQELGFNATRLKNIAEWTGGEVIDIDNLEQLVRSLPSRHVPIVERRTYPFWHQSWVIFIAIACLCGEWGLRRWRGLA